MFSKIWNDPVWSKVISVAIVAAAASALSFFLGWWPTIISGVSALILFLGSTVSMSKWILVLLIFLSLPTVIIPVALLWSYLRGTSTSSHWSAYTTDEFMGLKWRWRYSGNDMENPLAFCPFCDYQINPTHGSDIYGNANNVSFHCDNCSRHLASFDDPYSKLTNKVMRLAQLKIRNNTFPNGT